MTNWIAVVITFTLFIASQDASAELYRFVDSKGDIQIVDSLDKVPEAQRDKAGTYGREASRSDPNGAANVSSPSEVKSALRPDKCETQLSNNVNKCREYLAQGSSVADKRVDPDLALLMYSELCGHALLQGRLTSSEKMITQEIAKRANAAEHRLQAKDVYEAKMTIAYFFSPCTQLTEKKYSRQELDELGGQFQALWKSMASALSVGDIEKAIRYYQPPVQDAWRKRYASYSKEQQEKIGQSMLRAQIFVERVDGGGRAVCHLLTTRDGQRTSNQLIIVKGPDGAWMINSY